MRLTSTPEHRPGAWRGWMLLPLFAFLLLLAACSGSDDSSSPTPTPTPTPPPSVQARTTVLVYLVASDLETNFDAASKNIEEMIKVGSSQDVQIILETGASKKEGWTTVRRQRVVKGGTEVLADLGAQRMSDGENLRKFIEWGVKAYPAQSYHLVFWNHGGGPLQGFGHDENYPEHKAMMSMPEMAAALEGAQRTTGVQFDLIGFDACLMASAEVAYTLRPYGRYMVASEDVEPGAGWDWEGYLRHLADNAESTPVSAGKAIIDGYVAKMADTYQTMVTLSLVDLAKIAPLMDRFNDVAATIVDKLNDTDMNRRYDAWADLAYARRYTHDFQTSWVFGDAYDLVDMADFVTMPKLAGFGVSEAQIDAVQSALEQAVIYNKYGKRLWGASGLTLYSPLVSVQHNRSQVYGTYATLAVPDSIKAMVQRYGDIARSPDLPSPIVSPLQREGDIYYSTLRNAKFSAIEYAALWRGTERLAIKPLDAVAPRDPAVDDVRIAAHITEGWFQIPSADGADVLVSVLPDDIPRFAVGHAQYSVPVLRLDGPNGEFGGTSGVLIVEYEEDLDGSKTYRIVSFLASDDASPYAARADSESLAEGIVFYPMIWMDGSWEPDTTQKIVSYAVGDENTPRDQWWQLKKVTATPTLCGGPCDVNFGIVSFSGNLVQ